MRREIAPVLLGLRLTAITLLLRPMGPWGVRPVLLILAAAALLSPRVLASQATWFALTALITIRLIVDWPLPDNHVFLLAYWCFAVALALGAPDPAATLATSGRLLLGLAFLAAVLWKAVLSPEYLDGRFFRVTLLTDDRFAGPVRLVGGLTSAEIDRNREILAPLPEGAELLDPPALVEPPAFAALVRRSTAGLLTAEAMLAVAFLAPFAGRTMLPHALLISFSIVTYAFAPVAGFGWLLLSIGAALCRRDERALRAAYVATWCLVLLYAEVPWARTLAGAMGQPS
jgi:hypothetical protein